MSINIFKAFVVGVFVSFAEFLPPYAVFSVTLGNAVKMKFSTCCSKVIMSGVNGNVIMSGYGDDNPDDEGREAARDNTKSVSSRTNDGEGIVGFGSQ